MRLFHVAVVLSLFLSAGCNKSGDAPNAANGATGSPTQTGANFQLVKLKLPGMT